ncbi:mRNA (guanine-N(7))-methyltransferase,mRNA (guanine-N(7))-methyltransferase domain,S-adenosyl-L- [Cinara cedri]|uniref:mRNA cap guanine-N(7) methyltransferase n=1 Tax=Cinara cedri TaxID=506608 RepID=A0A5E4N406_9HEMI|nr:mRNA (guanine-N(7))-methyltransferase,mRNA (guanine-N(7))-methyltransferase domain,S-adenosyl-L- [Cinara cedri]
MVEVTETKEQLSATIARHYDNGENDISARFESRILYLRNFNNWVKSTLIQEAVLMLRNSRIHDGKMNVLDLACGKGGDLIKWKNASCMEYLVAVDVSQGSIFNCRSRYEDMQRRNRYLFDAKFIVADCTRVHINKFFKNSSMKLHLVSCQFAFHYCFESISQAECMLKNVSENLISGGIFIGTIPNANEIVRRQKECGKKQFGNSIYNIDFMCNIEEPFPIFGAKYNFNLEGVVDCPEFLVYFPVLVKLAKNYGLELKMKMNFKEYFDKHATLNSDLLNRITALEVYPPQEGSKIMGTEDDYDKAKQFLNENRLSSVGTLSTSEWEVATLYMVFMFQKL